LLRLSGFSFSFFGRLLTFGFGLSGLACSSLFPSGGGGAPAQTGPSTPTGCATAPTQPVTAGGYYVNGNTVCTAAGVAHLFHGVDRPSLEWSQVGENLSAADFGLMGSWKANVVRIALNQDFWLAGSTYSDPTYPARVDTAVGWAESAGLDVILDLHWSDTGVLGSCDPSGNCQQRMADANSKTFWSEVATRYQNDGRVLFELYNEPHDVTWGVWKNGGSSGQGWTVTGMQQLYKAVRDTGANNLVVIGGLNYAFDLSGVPANRIDGYNILYATHPYNTSGRSPGSWDLAWGNLTATDPVIVTEFGDSGSVTADGGTVCASQYSQELITYADSHNASWTAWAWFPGGCGFPSLVTDWAGTPNAPGQVVKAALGGYHDPAPDGTKVNTQAGDAGVTTALDAGAHAQDAGGAPTADASSQ
jgi:endoglucanase